jgi:DHA2 family multidrug resistance protein
MSGVSALYVMVRNVAGSIGISGATALVTQRTQAHQSYLSEQLSPLNSNYNALLAQTTATLRAMGHSAASAHSAALGLINKTLVSQAGILAYTDVFAYAAIAAFCVAPLALLFKSTPGKPAGDAPPQH